MKQLCLFRAPGARRALGRLTPYLAMAGIIGLIASPVAAVTTFLVSPGDFSGSETVIDFEGFASLTPITTQYAGLGALFSADVGSPPVTTNDTPARQFGPPGLAALANTGTPQANNVIVTFTTPINRVGFEIRNSTADDLNLTLRVVSSGQTVATQFFITNLTYRFVGLESTVPFDQVLIDVTNIVNGVMRLDNLRFEALPNQDPECAVTGLLHESADLGAVGQTSGLSIFAGSPSSQFLGSRFSVDRTVEVTAIGGHLNGSGFGNGMIFGAIVQLAGPTALPIGAPLDSGEVVAAVAFNPGSPSNDARAPLSTFLSPGDYALVFGSNDFGATGMASMQNNNFALPGSNQILWDGAIWVDIGTTNLRFIVEIRELLVSSDASSSTITIDGGGSSDPEGGALTYSWSTDCPGGSFDDNTLATPTLTVSTPCPDPADCLVTLTVTDALGAFSTCSAPVSVRDGTAPTLAGVPGDVAAECDAVPAPAAVTATDNNDAAPTVTLDEVQTAGSCPDEYQLVRTWAASDACGNSSAASQTITVDDTTDPLITCPADAFGLECPADTSVAALGSATASDSCGSVTIGSSDVSVAGCGTTATITRTFSASDDCGNSASCDQTIATVDTTPPTILVDTTPITVADADCSGDEAVTVPAATANDACDGSVAVTNDAPATFPAGETTTVTYSATDACGNTGTAAVDAAVKYGATIKVDAQQMSFSFGWHPVVQKEPIEGMTILVYERPGHEFCGHHHGWWCGWHWWRHVFYECNESLLVNTGVTDANGIALIDVPPGDYLVIGLLDIDDDGEADHFIGEKARGVDCGDVRKVHLRLIITPRGKALAAKLSRYTGSELLVVEPDMMVWDEPEQEYPYGFESEGDWGVSVTVAPPEGFVADYESLSTEVINEVEGVQFTVTEVGSDLVPTKTTLDVTHNGHRFQARSEVGIILTPEYAVSRGFSVDRLRSRGLIQDDIRQGERGNRLTPEREASYKRRGVHAR